jgi:iron complex outermembrane receptor protein
MTIGRFCCSTALIALSVAPQAARAQAAAPAASPAAVVEDNAADIVVTARRVEERLQDVPISITAFSQQQLTNRNIVSAGDIAIYTPSLSTNSRFGAEKTSFAIRGFNQDTGAAPSVGVYFADAPAPRVVSSTAAGNGAGPGSFFDLQNLQVLKGPQGTLFGRNTSGGAVLIVPQRPTGRLEGYVEGSLGNHELRRLQGVLNVPVSDTLRVRAGVDRQTREGYIRNVSGIGPGHFNDIDYWAGRLSIIADITPNLENYIVGTYSKSDTNGSLPRVFACNRTQAATSALVALQCAQLDRAAGRGFYTGEAGLLSPYQNVEQWQVVNTTSWTPADTLTVKNIFAYSEFREATRGTVYGENMRIVTGPNAGRNAVRVFSNPFPGLNTASGATLTEELQLQGNALDSRLTWQAGAYMERNTPLGYAGVVSTNTGSCATDDPFLGCGPFTPAAGAPVATTTLTARTNQYRLQDYALYAQATYKLTDQLSATGGIRYTWDRYQLTSRQINYAPVPPTANPPVGYCVDGFRFGARNTPTNPGTLTLAQCQTHLTGHSQAPTWLIDLDYKPVDDVLLYAKYARGYRQGQLKAEGYGQEAFRPEKIDDYEVGIKTSWRGPIRGTLNIAGFYNDFSDQQLTASGTLRIPGTTPAQLIVNAGKSTIKGVEIDASVTPFHGFTLDAAYAYLDTEVKSLTVPPPDIVFSAITLSGARVGYPLTYSPKNKLTITGTYTLPLPDHVGRLSVGMTYTHIDSQYASYQDTPAFLAGTIPYDYGKLPSLNLVNLNLNWGSVAKLPVDLALFVTNLTKKKYYNATFGGYPSFGLEAGAVGEPRMIGLRLKYRFGS